MATRLPDYEAFWLYYVAEHRNATCRRLHYAGTSLVLACLAVALATRQPLWLLACPVAGYAFAWLGHAAFEHNRPATFTHPLWSLRADFRMFAYWLTGRMPEALRQAEAAYPAKSQEATS